jgi:predicted transcriptional regulator of viral defense system
MPEYCGGIREIIFGFEKAVDKISAPKILEYAQKTSIAVCKRLGWILEQIQQFEQIQQVLQNIPVKQYQKLDPNNGRSGKYSKRWMIVENI